MPLDLRKRAERRWTLTVPSGNLVRSMSAVKDQEGVAPGLFVRHRISRPLRHDRDHGQDPGVDADLASPALRPGLGNVGPISSASTSAIEPASPTSTAHSPTVRLLKLCRLRYAGSASQWRFAIYRASHDVYQDSYLPTGSMGGTPGGCPRHRLRPLPQRPHRLDLTPDELRERPKGRVHVRRSAESLHKSTRRPGHSGGRQAWSPDGLSARRDDCWSTRTGLGEGPAGTSRWPRENSGPDGVAIPIPAGCGWTQRRGGTLSKLALRS